MGVFGFPMLEGALHADLVAVQIDGPQARSSRRRMVIAETTVTHPANFTHRFRRRPQKKEAHKHPWEVNDKSIGDAYCFVAIERKSKLVLNPALGRRNQATTDLFIEGLRPATASRRFQITTDGFQPYISAIDTTLSDRADYGVLIKVYAAPREGEQRYSPADVVEAVPKPVLGNPDRERICTSHVERQNLTMRMQIRRLTRLTNGFSKKWENHWAALALHFVWYNLVQIHRTIRVTPAMEAGITDHIWTIRELLKAA